MKMLCAILAVLFAACISGSAASAQASQASAPTAGTPPTAEPEAKGGKEYSGMYSFLEDGEFVQISVEDDGKVTGFISRYSEGESDKRAFLDQFFRSGKLEGNKLNFTTDAVHGLWFEFKGTVERGEEKSSSDEGRYVLKGTLTDNVSDAEKKVTSHSREVVLKMFPEEPPPPARN